MKSIQVLKQMIYHQGSRSYYIMRSTVYARILLRPGCSKSDATLVCAEWYGCYPRARSQPCIYYAKKVEVTSVASSLNWHHHWFVGGLWRLPTLSGEEARLKHDVQINVIRMQPFRNWVSAFKKCGWCRLYWVRTGHDTFISSSCRSAQHLLALRRFPVGRKGYAALNETSWWIGGSRAPER